MSRSERAALAGAGIVALAAVIALLTLSSYDLGILAMVVTYTIAALAQNLLAGYAGIPSLGNVIFFAAGAYVAGSLVSLAGAPLVLAVGGAVAAGAAVGLIIGVPALRVAGMHLAIVTVALVFAAQDLMAQWDTDHAPAGLTMSTPGWLLTDRATYIAAILAAGVAYVAAWNVLRARTGRALVAGSDNRFAALSAGVNVAVYRLVAFVLSGAITALAGVIYLYYAHTVTPTVFPIDLSLAFLTMVILGGSRSIPGSLVGALVIGLLPQFLRLFPAEIASINIQQSISAIYAILLLLALRLFPDGLWNALAAAAQTRWGGEESDARSMS